MSTQEKYNERELLLSISEGDEKAFAVFFEHHYIRLRPFVSRFFSNSDEIEDALQETFIRIWLNRDQLPEIVNIGGWMRTIVSRICISALRKELNPRFIDSTNLLCRNHRNRF